MRGKPNRTLKQQRFKLDLRGRLGASTTSFTGRPSKKSCGAYNGPALVWQVTACKAPDGSYWALQKWQVQLPDLGFTPWTSGLRQWELHLSHWTTLGRAARGLAGLGLQRPLPPFVRSLHIHGPARLWLRQHSFRSTDRRLRPACLYVDTHNSAYGSGLEARELLPRPQSDRHLSVTGFYKHNAGAGGYAHPPGDHRHASEGQRRHVQDHCIRAGRHA